MEPPSSRSQPEAFERGPSVRRPSTVSKLHVDVLNHTDVSLPTEPISIAVSVALRHRGYNPSEVNVLLTSDEDLRRLNREFRRLDEPTDVLTFPSDEEGNGDIAIAIPYALRQAAVRGVQLEQEVAYLAIHGALHLAGMDDIEEADRDEMVGEMNAVAAKIGLLGDLDWSSLLHEVPIR